MKNILLTLTIFFGLSTFVLAQEQDSLSKKEKAIVVNFNVHQNAFYAFNDAFEYQIGFPSLEYQARKDKRILSLELAKITWNQSPTYQINSGGNQTLLYNDKYFQAIARVQFQWLLRDDSKKLQPFWGASFSPYYSQTKQIPEVSIFFPKTSTMAGIAHHFSLGTYYNFDRYFIQANALVGIGHVGVVSQNIENPAIVPSAQRNSILDINLFTQDHLFRIGIGMKL